MSTLQAFIGADIFDGDVRHAQCALLIEDGRVLGIVPASAVPPDAKAIELDGGLIAPGFVDLQVNGGGGVLFNESPDVDAIRTICKAHAQFGTTALLVTLITDTVEVTEAAIAAGAAAVAENVPGFLGLHIEGPHLSISKKGAHDPALVRRMDNEDQKRLEAAAASVPMLMTTVAPESVTPSQISSLTAAGVRVSIGHTAASFAEVRAAAEAGACMVTHLFNAMSPLTHREPGTVGAALRTGTLFAGLIADGYHVDPEVIAIALAAKQGPGKLFLVTDAMSSIGTDQTSFNLNGRTIRREDGRLTLADGTLAGADLDMISAVRFMVQVVGVSEDEALRMASLYPAQAIGAEHLGHLKTGAAASMVHLDGSLTVERVWIEGRQIDAG